MAIDPSELVGGMSFALATARELGSMSFKSRSRFPQNKVESNAQACIYVKSSYQTGLAQSSCFIMEVRDWEMTNREADLK
jgi:hypothetical protein